MAEHGAPDPFIALPLEGRPTMSDGLSLTGAISRAIEATRAADKAELAAELDDPTGIKGLQNLAWLQHTTREIPRRKQIWESLIDNLSNTMATRPALTYKFDTLQEDPGTSLVEAKIGITLVFHDYNQGLYQEILEARHLLFGRGSQNGLRTSLLGVPARGPIAPLHWIPKRELRETLPSGNVALLASATSLSACVEVDNEPFWNLRLAKDEIGEDRQEDEDGNMPILLWSPDFAIQECAKQGIPPSDKEKVLEMFATELRGDPDNYNEVTDKDGERLSKDISEVFSVLDEVSQLLRSASPRYPRPLMAYSAYDE
jgi:hypothetical protein